MDSSPGISEHDWLGACRLASKAITEVLERHPTSRERIIETGSMGSGGDSTLVIDAEAEQRVFDALETLHDQGARFTAISEERGVVDYGSEQLVVVIDPIDGSLNAKRGMPGHALSIAVATGMTMQDVCFGYVHDFGTGDEWRAQLGGGAFLNDRPIEAPPERRDSEGRLELVAIESASPRLIAQAIEPLQEVAYRIRAVGAIAISVCQVANTRVDAMASLRTCRSVDAAAAQLIVRESGGVAAFLGGEGEAPLDAPLDLDSRRCVIAARNETALAEVASIPILDGPS